MDTTHPAALRSSRKTYRARRAFLLSALGLEPEGKGRGECYDESNVHFERLYAERVAS